MPLSVNYHVLEESKFEYPFRIFISGSSQSGKTYFAREVLKNSTIFQQEIRSVRHCHPDYLPELPVGWHELLHAPAGPSKLPIRNTYTRSYV